MGKVPAAALLVFGCVLVGVCSSRMHAAHALCLLVPVAALNRGVASQPSLAQFVARSLSAHALSRKLLMRNFYTGGAFRRAQGWLAE